MLKRLFGKNRKLTQVALLKSKGTKTSFIEDNNNNQSCLAGCGCVSMPLGELELILRELHNTLILKEADDGSCGRKEHPVLLPPVRPIDLSSKTTLSHCRRVLLRCRGRSKRFYVFVPIRFAVQGF